MKNIFTPVIAAITFTTPFTANAQCTATISGDNCINASLLASVSGTTPNTVEWYRNGVLEQVKGKRNPNAVVAAGGGTTDNGQLYESHDVAVDKDGNIYVVDDGRQRVMKWAPGATEGILVAGGNGKGSALNQFFTPQGIAVDKDGNVYVSDDLMARVTKWAPGATQGVVVAGGHGEGNAANQLFGPQNICLDAANNLYIADRWNDRVQKWAPGATSGTTVAGGNGRGTAANQLGEPMDVVVDASNNVYVTDYFNNRVQKWAPGAITGVTVAGGNGAGYAANQFNFTTALAIGPDGALYVRDQNNYRIQKWTAGATFGITVAGGIGYGNGLNNIGAGFGLFVDGGENVFVSELFTNMVQKFMPSSTTDMQFVAIRTGSYTATVRGTGCDASAAVWGVFTAPVKPARIFGPATVLPNQGGLVFHVADQPGSTYEWTVPADARIVAGQGYRGIRVRWGTQNGPVTVTVSNSCGPSVIKQKYIYVNPAAAAQEENIIATENTGVQLYPNPVVTNAVVRFTLPASSAYTVRVYDVTGKTVLQKNAAGYAGSNMVELDVSKLSKGSYYVTITDDKQHRQSTSFVKQ